MLIVNLWHNNLENLLLNEDQVLQGCLLFDICMLYLQNICMLFLVCEMKSNSDKLERTITERTIKVLFALLLQKQNFWS